MRRPEQALQIAVAHFLRLALKDPIVWSAIGHGGGGKIRGALLKAMGLRPGLPDIVIIAPGYQHAFSRSPLVVGLELKSETGRQSTNQKLIQERWQFCGAHYFIARSVDEVEGFLRGVGIPLHATAMGRAA